MLEAGGGRTMQRMKTRTRVLLTTLAFALAFFGGFADRWNPLLTLQMELRLRDPVCVLRTWRWIGEFLALVPFVVPICGAVLSLGAFAASFRRGHRPGVAPAFAVAIAASAMLGVGGLLTWVTHWPYGPHGVVNGLLHTGWIVACVAPAVLMRVPLRRLRWPLLALGALVVAFFTGASAVQYVDRHTSYLSAFACAEY
jgi:hypothetical protein